MGRYNILDSQGSVVNVVIASSDLWMEQHYPGSWGAVPELPAAAPPLILSRLAFLSRFTAAERKAIRQAAKVNADIEDWLELFNAAQEVDVTYPATISGIQALESAGILAVGRAAEILGG